MFRTDKVFILPCDGALGDNGKPMTEPRMGFFSVKFGKGHLVRAMQVECSLNGFWQVHLDGFLIAPSSKSWRKAFGDIFRASDKSNGVLVGRPISVDQYCSIVKSRTADKERGIDLSATVNLNSVEPPTFRSGK